MAVSDTKRVMMIVLVPIPCAVGLFFPVFRIAFLESAPYLVGDVRDRTTAGHCNVSF